MPRAGHGAGQRGGHRRQERARRPSGRAHAAAPVDAADHRLRRRLVEDLESSTGPSRSRNAAQLDRPERGRGSRFPDRPGAPDPRRSASSPRGPTRSSARPTWSSRRSIRSSSGSRTPEQREAVEAYRQAAARKSDLDRTDLAKNKTGVFTGAYAINPVNGQQIPDLDRRLCADGLRHRRDHGRARPRRARLRVRPGVRPADRPRRGAEPGSGRRHPAPAPRSSRASRSTRGTTRSRSTACPRPRPRRRSRPGSRSTGWASRRSITSCATGSSRRQRYWGEPFPVVWTSRTA